MRLDELAMMYATAMFPEARKHNGPLNSVPIEVLRESAGNRVMNALYENGVKTIGDVLSRMGEMPCWRNFGPTSERKLQSALNGLISPTDLEAQRRSFAYGNASLSNPDVTREIVDREAERMKGQADA